MSDKPSVLKATHEGVLNIAGSEIPCYVLEDKRRVVDHRGILRVLGIREDKSSQQRRQRIAHFVSGKRVGYFVGPLLLKAFKSPLALTTKGNKLAFGYEATCLVKLCEAVVNARGAGRLQKQQFHVVTGCKSLLRALAQVSMDALVDEVTGYQHVTLRLALQPILAICAGKELAVWERIFPDEFYNHLFTLRRLRYDPNSTRSHRIAANLTIDIVYSRLAPGILKELKTQAPRNDQGQLDHEKFSSLACEHPYIKLKEHLSNVTVLMRASPSWAVFYRLLQRALPKSNAIGLSDEEVISHE